MASDVKAVADHVSLLGNRVKHQMSIFSKLNILMTASAILAIISSLMHLRIDLLENLVLKRQ